MLNVTTRIDKLETIEEIKVLMEAVATIREYFGLSRQEFALLCDIPPHSYRVLEKHGKGDLVSLYKLLTTLHKRFSIDLNILLATKKYSTDVCDGFNSLSIIDVVTMDYVCIVSSSQ